MGRPLKEAADRHGAIADTANSVLLIIDVQEAFRGKLDREEEAVKANIRILTAAEILNIPVVVTEQYPERLGTTMREVADAVPSTATILPKRTFSCWGAEDFVRQLAELGRRQVILTGLETHICVSQTAHDLLHHGYGVHVVRDAVTSRFTLESEVGFQKMVGSGATPTSVEAVLFEWLRDSRSPEFKAVQRLVL